MYLEKTPSASKLKENVLNEMTSGVGSIGEYKKTACDGGLFLI